MLAEVQSADAYREMTDSTRDLVRWTRDKARQWQRVKPDEELHPLAELDYEGVANREKEGRASVIHAADFANPVRDRPDILAMLLAHELDYALR
jgi:hypothetical protein